MSERIIIKIEECKLLSKKINGYYSLRNNGFDGKVFEYFYRLKSNSNIYVASTTKLLRKGMEIKASIIGNKEYKGEKQIWITRISYINLEDAQANNRENYKQLKNMTYVPTHENLYPCETILEPIITYIG